ncbi:MAG: hypothetical protein E6I22_04920 [Chloroflexi bacterium]|nr:MAG: hypothetical protein E6I22_04920 [Chloroflexota bacterium]TMG40287.1 MAG: hypothetical protein E6H92_03025 [Chloroflexota bacterium]
MRSPALVAGGLVLLALSGAVALASPQANAPTVPQASAVALNDASSWPVPRMPKATPTPTATPTPAPTPHPAVAATAPAQLTGQFTFPVPVRAQTMNLDCETAALQMALMAMGHSYSQSELFSLEKPDTRAPIIDRGPPKRVIQWGDPYTNFVGNVNGADLIPTGYGVYWPVILSIAQSHGAPNSYGHEGFSAAEIYAAVRAGHPVEAWTETGWDRPYVGYWTAWDGRQIRYSLIEHTVILSGVSANSVRVNDPWRGGSQYWISKAKFEVSWRDFNNMAIVFQ